MALVLKSLVAVLAEVLVTSFEELVGGKII
jgi:hypothetical protein